MSECNRVSIIVMGSFSTPFQVSEIIQAQTRWDITRHRFYRLFLMLMAYLIWGTVWEEYYWSTSSPSWEGVGTNKSATPINKIRGWRWRLLFFDVNLNKDFLVLCKWEPRGLNYSKVQMWPIFVVDAYFPSCEVCWSVGLKFKVTT